MYCGSGADECFDLTACDRGPIVYFGVPNTAAGSADLFVIHCESDSLRFALTFSIKASEASHQADSPLIRTLTLI